MPVNPIQSIDGAQIHCPSSFVWKLEDVSASDAGRTEDGLMHKKRIRQVIGIELAWNSITTEIASQVLNAFDPEYISMTYLDPKEGTFVTKTFYVGNRSSPLYNATSGLWENVNFNIIQR